MPIDLKTSQTRCHNQLEVSMDTATNYDLKCPCCGKLNRSINLIETRGTMECIRCHVLAHVNLLSNGEIEIISFDGDTAPVAEHLWSAFGWLTAQPDSPVKLVASRFSAA